MRYSLLDVFIESRNDGLRTFSQQVYSSNKHYISRQSSMKVNLRKYRIQREFNIRTKTKWSEKVIKVTGTLIRQIQTGMNCSVVVPVLALDTNCSMILYC